jgi:hypothetical protein
MLILIAFAVVCLALIVYLRQGPSRSFPGSGSFMWRGRTLSEEDAAKMVRDRLRADEGHATLDRKASALRDKV